MNYESTTAKMIQRAPHGTLVNGNWVIDPVYIVNHEKSGTSLPRSLAINRAGLMSSQPSTVAMDALHTKVSTIHHFLGTK